MMGDFLSIVAALSDSFATLVRLAKRLLRFGGIRSRNLGQISDSDQVVDGGSELEDQPTSFTPRCRVLRISPTVFNQPKISSTRLRLR